MEAFKIGIKLKLSQLLLYLLVIVLIAHSSVTIFSIHIPFPVPARFSRENAAGNSRTLVFSSSSGKVSSFVMHAVKEEGPAAEKKTLLYKDRNLGSFRNSSSVSFHIKKRHSRRALSKILGYEGEMKLFSKRVKEFFHPASANSSCKFRFFMTWISSSKLFGKREISSMESLFKSHPDGCLIIVSNSMDSIGGMEILRPFLDKGFRVSVISPDFNYLFKNTVAQAWLDKLTKGNLDPGEISLGQNLSNLLRLGLLYKFGGIYIDTDVLVLKRFHRFRNAIGAQTINLETGNWSRLNNAVMVFDKGHPLLYKFIEEFALTFDGNKWGHNGPYLVSRVVSRISERPGYNFTILPPKAFYPVDWSRIGNLFRAPVNESQSKWMFHKLQHIQTQSFAVHLWNKESRKLKIQKGSIIQHIMANCCIFCNNHTSVLGIITH
ncbi:OLC1v1021591C1 [Oldenlandia corymbosa var. corymbosa]|uniref:OLC1v1021591C1 n=1 Tax=Oldenlandia corymbosa var. corymbosa TaxID=529605 RepID=A0AAV1BZL9_OLDCO|nr:OLC1v1021591C1 [Oldenlandia corymbosa var. corymbosa]